MYKCPEDSKMLVYVSVIVYRYIKLNLCLQNLHLHDDMYGGGWLFECA